MQVTLVNHAHRALRRRFRRRLVACPAGPPSVGGSGGSRDWGTGAVRAAGRGGSGDDCVIVVVPGVAGGVGLTLSFRAVGWRV